MQLGTFFQQKDDYLDFANDGRLNKIGMDIKDGKCTWLILHALKHADEAQRRTLLEHYGKATDEDEAVVKRVYHEWI